MSFIFFFFNDTATTEIYTLSLHDALPIYTREFAKRGEEAIEGLDAGIATALARGDFVTADALFSRREQAELVDRKSTRLNSSHVEISYAVFCLKKKKNKKEPIARKNIK